MIVVMTIIYFDTPGIPLAGLLYDTSGRTMGDHV